MRNDIFNYVIYFFSTWQFDIIIIETLMTQVSKMECQTTFNELKNVSVFNTLQNHH